MICCVCFHSTKEGFKADAQYLETRKFQVFPFHQGRFQGTSTFRLARGVYAVSIPPRKVSRGYPRDQRALKLVFPFHQGRFQGREDFAHGTAAAAFPFHQGRFQGVWCIKDKIKTPEFPFHQGRFQGVFGGLGSMSGTLFPFHQGRFQGRSATSAPMFIQYSTSQSEKSVQGEKAASPCKQAIMHLSQTCVDPPPFSRHRGATHSLQGHTSKI